MKPVLLVPSTPGGVELVIIETTLIFAGIPVAVIVLIAGAVYAGGARAQQALPARPAVRLHAGLVPVRAGAGDQAAQARELTGARRAELTAGRARR